MLRVLRVPKFPRRKSKEFEKDINSQNSLMNSNELTIKRPNNSIVIPDQNIHGFLREIRTELMGPRLNNLRSYSTAGSAYSLGRTETPMGSRESSVDYQYRENSFDQGLVNEFETGIIRPSFDHMIERPSGLSKFEQKLREEFSEELIEFLRESRSWRRAFAIFPEENRLVFAKRIYDTYIEPGSPKQINISGKLAKKIKNNFDNFNDQNSDSKIDFKFFDDAIIEIIKLMENGPYHRMKCSNMS